MGPLLARAKKNCIVTKGGCWEWSGTRVKGGYGRTKIGSRTDGSRRSVLVHRAVFEEKYGELEEGMTVHHKCENPPCFRPSHLKAMTLWDNTKKSKKSPTAVNARKKRCPRCGAKYEKRPDGKGRRCRPCLLDYYKNYNANRKKTHHERTRAA
jgi:hypothetical protein